MFALGLPGCPVSARCDDGCLAERARPRAQQAPPAPTRWIFTDTPLALDTAAPGDGRAPLNSYKPERRFRYRLLLYHGAATHQQLAVRFEKFAETR